MPKYNERYDYNTPRRRTRYGSEGDRGSYRNRRPHYDDYGFADNNTDSDFGSNNNRNRFSQRGVSEDQSWSNRRSRYGSQDYSSSRYGDYAQSRYPWSNPRTRGQRSRAENYDSYYEGRSPRGNPFYYDDQPYYDDFEIYEGDDGDDEENFYTSRQRGRGY